MTILQPLPSRVTVTERRLSEDEAVLELAPWPLRDDAEAEL